MFGLYFIGRQRYALAEATGSIVGDEPILPS